MSFTRKYRTSLVAGTLVAAFLFTRLYGLMTVPIFTDEAIYLHWTEIFKADIHQLFISMTDGKQPLFIWIASIFIRLVKDPLTGIRLVSVASGLTTMVGLYFLTNEIFSNKKIGVLASALYIFSPFALIYDKLGLYDALLASFAVWALYLEIVIAKRRSIGAAIAALFVVSGGMLTKSSAFFFMYLMPFSLLVFTSRRKHRNKNFSIWLVLSALIVAGSAGVYSILRFSPNYHYIADKNHVFIHAFGEWFAAPFGFIGSNLPLLWSGISGYVTIPILILTPLAFAVSREYFREKVLLCIWFFVPFSALAFLGDDRYLYPRYILFMTMPLLVLAAYTINELVQKTKKVQFKILIVIFFTATMFYKDFLILADFKNASIPHADKVQLIDGFASGVGVQKSLDFIKMKSAHQSVYVATQGTFGLMPYAFQDELLDNKNVTVEGYWPIDKDPPAAVLSAAKIMPTYFVFYAPCPTCRHTGVAPTDWPLQKIFSIKRADGSYFTLYKVVTK